MNGPQTPPHELACPIQSPEAPLSRRLRLRLWWHEASGNMRGSVLIGGAILIFGVMIACIKEIGSDLPLPQIIVIRQIIITILLLPLFLPDLGATLRTDRLGLQLTRGLFSLMAMLCGFTAIIYIPLADATALGFSKVLFVTIAAVWILKEKVGPRRWLATFCGFLGVLIILAPGGAEPISIFYLLAVLGALFGAGINVTIRMLSSTERTETILLYQALVLFSALIIPTILWWQPPTLEQWGLLGVIGISGTAAQYLVTRAYQIGEASALAPLDFTRLLVAVATGFIFFAEIPGWRTLLGAAIVIGATFYTIRRNSAPHFVKTDPAA
jgi:drug/metabolite transporter (DMT)-like permease